VSRNVRWILLPLHSKAIADHKLDHIAIFPIRIISARENTEIFARASNCFCSVGMENSKCHQTIGLSSAYRRATMAKSAAHDEHKAQIVLSIDIGGSHVKVLTSDGGVERKAVSGTTMTAEAMVAAVQPMIEGLAFDVISMGYPGSVQQNRILKDPANLGPGWVDFDFKKIFGKPVKIVNDALMQSLGSYDGGRMLFLGLGTGLGSAMVLENVAQPLELAHLPYKKDQSFEDYVGERGLEKRGKRKWRRNVFDVVAHLQAALQPDYIIIGGGNVDKLDTLPEGCRRGDNTRAFEGGFRLWNHPELVV
jgi:polyphosphate glucokinase